MLAIDHVPLDERRRIDELTVSALEDWQAACRDALTSGDLSLPWLWETELIVGVFLPTVRQAYTARAALRALRPAAISLIGGDAATRSLVSVVARGEAIDLGSSARRRRRPARP